VRPFNLEPRRRRPPAALRAWLLAPLLAMHGLWATAQPLHHGNGFTRADTLRGSNGPFRAWWHATSYDVAVQPDFASKSIEGKTTIHFRALQPGQRMQVDLQQPLEIRSITAAAAGSEADAHYTREGNVAWVELPQALGAGATGAITVQYGGTPREAVNPPWDGGWIWKRTADGTPWMSVACQGLGASVWYPCKDFQEDKPDSAALHILVPDSLVGVGNGRLTGKEHGAGGTTWHWKVRSPISTYNLVPYIGPYVHLGGEYAGEAGRLDLDYWVLRGHEDQARAQFLQVPGVLHCFEDWFGPYPFYVDGYKLVEAPHLGMEHQSAIAYGNRYLNGYLGADLSGSGWGLKWDYVIVHETAHEWWGNSITAADIADMWVHEAFADYAEALYTECLFGKAAGEDYVIGLRRNIRNDIPITGPYGVNREGSTDMYYKGANMLHTIRSIMANDSLFKAMLREMNRRYRHAVVTGAEVEAFISTYSGHDFSLLFQQYLRTVQVPELQWAVRRGHLYIRLARCVPGLSMPVRITVNGEERTVPVGDRWSNPASGLKARTATCSADRNWYLTVVRVPQAKVRAARPR